MDVLMPQLGETVSEGKITQWFKSAGDAIKPGDNLFEIETDKVSMEVPSTAAGVLAEIRVAAGEVAPVGAIVAVIADGAGAAATSQAARKEAPEQVPKDLTRATSASPAVSPQATPPPPSPPQPSPLQPNPLPRTAAAVRATEPAAPLALDPFFEVRTPARNFGPARLAGGARVTPLARRLAAEAGIDLGGISPSGGNGRIAARDIAAAVASRAADRPPTGSDADRIRELYRDVPHEEVPLDGMRRTIATRLLRATQTIPHFHLTADADIGRLLELREQVNAAAPEQQDGGPAFKLSVNDFVIKAWAAALQRVPAANAVWAEDRMLRLTHSDIGVAVAIEGGLITPVIRQAEMKTLSAISIETKEMAARARARKLEPWEYQGGSSTISNLGMYGVRAFSAIINPPQSTILAVGAARRQAVETEDGGVAFASVLSVTLSCDHRAVDGAVGAQLLAAFRGFLEQPVTMLV